jgi:hypothetical protein
MTYTLHQILLGDKINDEMGRHVEHIREIRNAYGIMVRKPGREETTWKT